MAVALFSFQKDLVKGNLILYSSSGDAYAKLKLVPLFIGLVEIYGDAYREYMNKTTRWMGMPKSREDR